MRRSRFSEAQIIGMLKEHEAGLATADVCRKYVTIRRVFQLPTSSF